MAEEEKQIPQNQEIPLDTTQLDFLRMVGKFHQQFPHEPITPIGNVPFQIKDTPPPERRTVRSTLQSLRGLREKIEAFLDEEV